MTTVSKPIHRPQQRSTVSTVRDVTFNLLRECGLTTVFGNVGSTEEAFLENFPSDFRYVLGLQETSVIAMADGFAQATCRPALVNVHTAAGLGNAMGGLVTAYMNKTPLIVTAGQQAREVLLLEPWLTNVEPEVLPRPWVKWSYQPVRAQDVPAAFMRAIATALQPPAGPVFLSLPLDDWDQPCPSTSACAMPAASRAMKLMAHSVDNVQHCMHVRERVGPARRPPRRAASPPCPRGGREPVRPPAALCRGGRAPGRAPDDHFPRRSDRPACRPDRRAGRVGDRDVAR